MNFKHKAILLLCSLLISFVGAMPANAIICVSDSGTIKLELGFNGSCDCEEESSEHEQHKACDDSACDFVELKGNDDCSDMEIESFESDQRKSSVDFISYKSIRLFNFSPSLSELEPQDFHSFWPLTKPSIPPPHLEILSTTEVLI